MMEEKKMIKIPSSIMIWISGNCSQPMFDPLRTAQPVEVRPRGLKQEWRVAP
jgi:hypothetical protein